MALVTLARMVDDEVREQRGFSMPLDEIATHPITVGAQTRTVAQLVPFVRELAREVRRLVMEREEQAAAQQQEPQA